MAQHDYDVANGSGAAVRADLNALAQAIATLNSGAAAPTTTFANMFWYDTTNNILKVRNAANSAWLSAFTLSGGILVATNNLPLSGGTIVATNPSVALQKAASTNTATLFGTTGANNRWGFVLGNATAEGGANAGSDLDINSYTDAGALIANVLRITRSTGLVTLPIGQLAFPAAQNASAGANVLDDYEKGTATPTLAGTTAAGAGTYTIQTLNYNKLGQSVLYSLSLVWTAHTGTGNMKVAGMPFTSIASFASPCSIWATTLTYTANSQLVQYIGAAGTEITLNQLATPNAVAIPMDTAAQLVIGGNYFS